MGLITAIKNFLQPPVDIKDFPHAARELKGAGDDAAKAVDDALATMNETARSRGIQVDDSPLSPQTPETPGGSPEGRG